MIQNNQSEWYLEDWTKVLTESDLVDTEETFFDIDLNWDNLDFAKLVDCISELDYTDLEYISFVKRSGPWLNSMGGWEEPIYDESTHYVDYTFKVDSDSAIDCISAFLENDVDYDKLSKCKSLEEAQKVLDSVNKDALVDFALDYFKDSAQEEVNELDIDFDFD